MTLRLRQLFSILLLGAALLSGTECTGAPAGSLPPHATVLMAQDPVSHRAHFETATAAPGTIAPWKLFVSAVILIAATATGFWMRPKSH